MRLNYSSTPVFCLAQQKEYQCHTFSPAVRNETHTLSESILLLLCTARSAPTFRSLLWQRWPGLISKGTKLNVVLCALRVQQ